MEKALSLLICLLSVLSINAQSVTVPLNVARMIQHDLEVKDAQDTLIKTQELHIQFLAKEVNKMDSINRLKTIQLMAKDSAIVNLDKVIGEDKKIISKESDKGKVSWWWIPIAVIITILVRG